MESCNFLCKCFASLIFNCIQNNSIIVAKQFVTATYKIKNLHNNMPSALLDAKKIKFIVP